MKEVSPSIIEVRNCPELASRTIPGIATAFDDWDHRIPAAWQGNANRMLRKLRLPFRFMAPQPHMATVEARMNLFHLLELLELLEQAVANEVAGDVVDLGCNAGDSTVVMQRVITKLAPQKQVHAYYSFEGLPALSAKDR
jgi:hypothetical protein